jgi:lipopolysaccharide/colanic/teichoic acid biosynthesis glycosyltransferase
MVKGKNIEKVLIFFGDILAFYLSIYFAFYTRLFLEGILPLIPLGHGFSLYLSKWWAPLVVLITIGYYGGYGIVITIWDEFLILLRSLFVSFLTVWVLLSLQKEAETVSRVLITLSFVYMMITIPSIRFLLKLFIYRLFDMRSESFLFGLPGERERNLMRSLNDEWYSGYKIIDIMQKKSAKNEFNTCFVPMWYADEGLIKSIKADFRNLIFVSEISGLSFMNTEIKTFLSKNIALITTNNGLLSTRKMVFKRTFDIFFSTLVFIIFIPLFLVVMTIIKISSKGPVFFAHKRCGKNLSEFNMLKFRTMRINSDDLLKEYISENPDAYAYLKERNKLKSDPRVTKFGSILRKTSIDELPQLMNVIRGDMSIVGPRPDAKEAVDNFLSDYREIYARVRPGITGLWQVSGRSEVKYQERVKLDYLYVLNWSIWLDFVIILKTFKAILGGKGAY